MSDRRLAAAVLERPLGEERTKAVARPFHDAQRGIQPIDETAGRRGHRQRGQFDQKQPGDRVARGSSRDRVR